MARETPIPAVPPQPLAVPRGLRRLPALFGRAALSFVHHGDLFSGAAISFYALFSLLPLTILFVLLISTVFPHVHTARFIARLVGGAGRGGLLAGTVQDAYTHRQALGWLGSLTLVLAATGVFAAVQVGLDRVWQCHGRFFPARFAVGILMMAGSLLIFLSAIFGTVLLFRLLRTTPVETLLHMPAISRGSGGRAVAVANALAQFGIFWSAYRFLPNVPLRWRDTWPGAAVATILWQVASDVLGYYVGHVADYATLYSSLGVIVALLAWIYALACTFLFGAEFVAQYAPRDPALPRNRRAWPARFPWEPRPDDTR